MGTDAKAVNIEDIVKAVGIEKVITVDPYDVKASTAAVQDMINYHGPSVIISKRPCPLIVEKQKPYEVNEQCNACGVCVKAFGCPAISITDERAQIDTTLCNGCGVCFHIGCPAILRSEELDAKSGKPLALIDPALCTGCEVCAQVCPYDAIPNREQMRLLEDGAATACALATGEGS